MQGNSLLALAGLVNAVFTEISTQETIQAAKTPRETYISMQEWIAHVTDTMLAVLDGKLQTFGVPMAWCQQVSYKRNVCMAYGAVKSCATKSSIN